MTSTTPSAVPADDARFERGLRTLCRIERTERPGILDGFADVAPDLGRLVVEFAFGDIISRPGLELRERQLVTVAALAALGNAAPQLEFHLRGALNVGCTRSEITETLTRLADDAGAERSAAALEIARGVFDAAAELSPESAEESGLDPRTGAITAVAACTALGTVRTRLKAHVRRLLEAGGTEEQAAEAIVQMAVYAGVPATVNGLNAAREAFREVRGH